ncbi:MAG: CHAD domain-containing protein, partial [Planctomycetota bacterium]
MDGSYQLLAGRYVRRQIRQLIGQLEGMRKADDIEFVHRARVASRRLRAALGIFRDCFGR